MTVAPMTQETSILAQLLEPLEKYITPELAQRIAELRATPEAQARLHQRHTPLFTFHIEHIRAKQHGGTDDLTNLVLACNRCNRAKGPNLSSVDPTTGQVVRLFNPREDMKEKTVKPQV